MNPTIDYSSLSVSLNVCLSICLQDHSKNNESINLKHGHIVVESMWKLLGRAQQWALSDKGQGQFSTRQTVKSYISGSVTCSKL